MLAWSPATSRIYHLKPHDLLDLTPLQLADFKDDQPQVLV